MKSRMLVAMVTVVGLLALPSTADVVVSNVTEPERDHNVIDDQLWSAQGFVTDAQAHQLTEVRAIVGNEVGLSGAFAELRSSTPSGDLDTSPSGLITRFVIPDLSGPRAVRSFIPEASLVLPADTQYYFLVGANGPGSGRNGPRRCGCDGDASAAANRNFQGRRRSFPRIRLNPF